MGSVHGFLGEIYHEFLHLVMDDGVIPIKSFLTLGNFANVVRTYGHTNTKTVT